MRLATLSSNLRMVKFFGKHFHIRPLSASISELSGNAQRQRVLVAIVALTATIHHQELPFTLQH